MGDQYGNMMQVLPLRGVYNLALPGAVCNQTDGCAVGGAPTVLIQPTGSLHVEEWLPSGAVPLIFVDGT